VEEEESRACCWTVAIRIDVIIPGHHVHDPAGRSWLRGKSGPPDEQSSDGMARTDQEFEHATWNGGGGQAGGNKEIADTLNEEVQTISGQLLLLLSKLGDRPDEFNGASAFEFLGLLKEELKEMNSEINLLDVTTQKLVLHNNRQTQNLELLQDILKKVQNTPVGVTKAELEGMRDNLLIQVRAAIEPFIKLVAKTSSSRSDRGGLLIKRLVDLERGVVNLRATKMDVGTTAPLGFGPSPTAKPM
jgi:hypothetical protein